MAAFIYLAQFAGMVELADTPDLGSGAFRCGGSNPSIRTNNGLPAVIFFFKNGFQVL